MQDNPIILFDGVCNFCNTWINFAIRNDKKGLLRFAPLQSNAGERLRKKYNMPAGTDSVIFIEHDKVYFLSEAAVRIARHLSWPAKMFYAFVIVPRFIREPVYKWIARNRYKWFGKKDQCMIPGPDVRARFLD
jgi:predicted DCC family thiol-disulfide oxidoreductase YuxK